MESKSFCPRCENYIPPARKLGGFAVCTCGWFDSTPFHETVLRIERATAIGLVLAAMLLGATYMHLMSWEQYAGRIPVLKLRQWTGTLSADGYHELARACADLGKSACTESSYRAYFKKSRNPEALASLASFRARMGKKEEAMKAYAAYFKAGGERPAPMVAYARLAEDAGQLKVALAYYKRAGARGGQARIEAMLPPPPRAKQPRVARR